MIIDREGKFTLQTACIPLSFPGELSRTLKVRGIEEQGCFRLKEMHE
jgi:hypothetical protein